MVRAEQTEAFRWSAGRGSAGQPVTGRRVRLLDAANGVFVLEALLPLGFSNPRFDLFVTPPSRRSVSTIATRTSGDTAEHVIPLAIFVRQVPPLRACPRHPYHAFHERPTAARRPAACASSGGSSALISSHASSDNPIRLTNAASKYRH